MNKILRKDNEDLFERILDDYLEESYSEHRRGSNFFTRVIYEVDEEYFPDLDPSYYGFWESNTFIHDTEYGHDPGDIYELTKVQKQEKIITTIEWKPIN